VSSDRAGLARRLTTTDAVLIGLGSMIGAGIFAAAGPAAEAAGSWLLAGLVIAGCVAFANATSSAQLAALYPESGGTYVYARELLGPFWGFLAGWGFVVGKLASLSAIALTFGTYAAPSLARPVAVGAVLALTVVNYRGVEKTARLTAVIVALVLVALAVAVFAMLGGGHASVHRVSGDAPFGASGVFRASALLFFAFAGYARLATLGEEVRDPQRTIPRAIPLALGLTVLVYLVVLGSALVAVGPDVLARSSAPLAAAVEAGRWSGTEPIVRIGAAIASLGVLLSLLAGVSRTALAMARRSEFPRALDAVHAVHRTPHRAEVAAAVVVCGVVLVADLRDAIGFSSTTVLVYYALTNASAWSLRGSERRWPRALAAFGFAGCLALCLSLPVVTVAAGFGILAAGAAIWGIRHRRGPRARV
jgi:basic amino acid/polyamine antiporter, APA family